MTTTAVIFISTVALLAIAGFLVWAFSSKPNDDYIIGSGKPISESIDEQRRLYESRMKEKENQVKVETPSVTKEVTNIIDFSNENQLESTIILNALLKNNKTKVATELSKQKGYDIKEAKKIVSNVIIDAGLIWVLKEGHYVYP